MKVTFEQLLAIEHARGRKPHDTSTGSHASDQDEFSRRRNITIKFS